MRIQFRLNEVPFDHPVASGIGELLNGAEVLLADIHFDSTNGIAELRATQFPVVGQRKTWFGLRLNHRDTKGIDYTVRILNIEKQEVAQGECEGIAKIKLLFGIGFREREIFFGSAEEATGKQCFVARYFGSDLAFELYDAT